MEYTAITTIYNDKDEIVELLRNLEHQTLPPIKIIIVDGGSGDETISAVNSYISKSTVPIEFIVEGKKNISQGFNAGIRHAKTEFIAIVAVGNFYKTDYFAKLSKRIKEMDLDYSYSPFWGQDNGAFSKLYNRVLLNKNRGLELPIASNHGVLIRKSIFEKLGYFYEYFIYAGEDLEFYRKVLNSGYKGEIVLDAKVYWDTPHTWKEYIKQVKVYTIARMQIYTVFEILNNEKVKFIYSIGALGALLSLVFKYFRYISRYVFGVYFIINMTKARKNGIKFVLFKNADIFLTTFNYLFHCKYMKKEYKVDDDNRLKP